MKQITKPTVRLLWSTPEPRKIIALAARMTYSAMPVSQLAENLGEEEIVKSVNAILERRHYSVLRHVVFMFSIEGVSRAFSHQLVRHTAGFSYEMRSQHYRTDKNFNLVMPDLPDEAKEIYVAEAECQQNAYDYMMELGVKKEDARFVLPNGCETNLVMTANLEAIVNLCKARSCRVNTAEILGFSLVVRRIVCQIIPEMKAYLGPTCWTTGICYEGSRKYYDQCRKPWKPAVLWTSDFPTTIQHISVEDNKEAKDE